MQPNITGALKDHDKRIADLEAELRNIRLILEKIANTQLAESKIKTIPKGIRTYDRRPVEEKRRLVLEHLKKAPDFSNNIARAADIKLSSFPTILQDMVTNNLITIDHKEKGNKEKGRVYYKIRE